MTGERVGKRRTRLHLVEPRRLAERRQREVGRRLEAVAARRSRLAAAGGTAPGSRRAGQPARPSSALEATAAVGACLAGPDLRVTDVAGAGTAARSGLAAHAQVARGAGADPLRGSRTAA